MRANLIDTKSSDAADDKQPSRAGIVGVWVIVIIQIAASLAQTLGATIYALKLTSFFVLVCFAFWHGSRRYGAVGMGAFFLISEIVSNALENLSISTGFPFGHYFYTQQPGAIFLFQVPLAIGLSYFANGYLAWTIANLILDKADERLRQRLNCVLLPLTAAFVMVMWDLAMDPINSTIRHLWIWKSGGGFNGVPLTNYLGWFLTVYIFFQTFASILRPEARVRRVTGKSYWLQAVSVHLSIGISFPLAYLVCNAQVVQDATGNLWRTENVYESAAIISLFTLIFASFLALEKVFSTQLADNHTIR